MIVHVCCNIVLYHVHAITTKWQHIVVDVAYVWLCMHVRCELRGLVVYQMK